MQYRASFHFIFYFLKKQHVFPLKSVEKRLFEDVSRCVLFYYFSFYLFYWLSTFLLYVFSESPSCILISLYTFPLFSILFFILYFISFSVIRFLGNTRQEHATKEEIARQVAKYEYKTWVCGKQVLGKPTLTNQFVVNRFVYLSQN